MSVWGEKPETNCHFDNQITYLATDMDAWLEKVKDRHLQLIEENKQKREQVVSLQMLNEALLTAIDLERKTNADMRETIRKLRAGEVTKEEYYEMKGELMQTLVEIAENGFEMLMERRKK